MSVENAHVLFTCSQLVTRVSRKSNDYLNNTRTMLDPWQRAAVKYSGDVGGNHSRNVTFLEVDFIVQYALIELTQMGHML
mmetsp:Transcript_57071/g.77859  ORF Transcript_57071/g.77859 Transcript_57071/m.77859 type:complete len:80 (-) Transcript_57071:634-873(-)